MIILSKYASCSACGPASEVVCAHLSRSGWSCVCCGARAASSASLLSVAWGSLVLAAQGLVLEVRLGRLSRLALVRWFSGAR